MRYGLIGKKLGHSFSKVIHEKLADYTYDLIPLSEEALDAFLSARDFSALNVTIPYKETVIPYLDALDTHAKKIGAVNTIVNQNGILTGYNTDFFGFRYLLLHNGIDVKGKKVLVLGKGGAAKAVWAVLEALDAAMVLTVYHKPHPQAVTYAECYQKHTDADIIINTTPVGMYPNGADCPIQLDRFPALKGVVDVIYNPLRTKLIVEAQKRGIPAAGGLEMLVAQAKYAAEIFLCKKIAEDTIENIHRTLLEEQRNLVLIGMSGSGKTTLGRQTAKQLGKAFVDTDAEISKRIGMPIANFFATKGEAAFRQIEAEVVAELSSANGLVISTGGGVVKKQENIDLLRQNGSILWLKRDAALLESGKGRPLAPDADVAEQLYRERLPLYIAAADAIAENNGTEEEGLLSILTTYKKT